MAEDYDVIEEDREEEAKLRKSKIYCKFMIYIMTSIYHFALGKYIYLYPYIGICYGLILSLARNSTTMQVSRSNQVHRLILLSDM